MLLPVTQAPLAIVRGVRLRHGRTTLARRAAAARSVAVAAATAVLLGDRLDDIEGLEKLCCCAPPREQAGQTVGIRIRALLSDRVLETLDAARHEGESLLGRRHVLLVPWAEHHPQMPDVLNEEHGRLRDKGCGTAIFLAFTARFVKVSRLVLQ